MFERIAETGLLISEWPPGSEPLRHRFLIRNRVIAAATQGTIMVEAAARSGAVQTMGRVLELHRKAMVVPGPTTSAMSVGCHELIRSNPAVRLVTGLPHVLEEIGKIGDYEAERPRGPEHQRDQLDEDAAILLEAVPRRGRADPAELAAKAGLSLRTVLRRLSLLETLGLVTRHSDGAVALRLSATRAPAARNTDNRPTSTVPGATPGSGPGAMPGSGPGAMPGSGSSGDQEDVRD
jgi:DNA processing protein